MIRKKILESMEEYVTEDELLKKLDITRDILQSNINKLKEAGYIITFDEDKGYILDYVPDIIDEYEIKRGLDTKYIGQDIYFYEELESTNITAKEFVNKDINEGLVVIAAKQTGGKTRKDVKWASPDGGIYMTMFLKPSVCLEKASKLTIITGVAIAKTLHDNFNIPVGIKWPNDILIGKKKICGILTEAITDHDKLNAILIGIGIDVNINKEDIPEELIDIATSIKEETQIELKRADILRIFFKIFEELYEEFKKENFEYIISEWRRLSSTLVKKVKVNIHKKEVSAYVIGISRDGSLVIELDDGKLEKISYGEITILDDK